jgi:hypothetical protein
MTSNHPSRTRAARKRREAREETAAGDTCQPVPQAPPARRYEALSPTIRRVGEAADDLVEAVRSLSVEEVGRLLERVDRQDFDLVLLQADAAHLADAILS